MTTEKPAAALSTSDGARSYIAHFFAREMRRHDFATYIASELAADFACALAQHLAARQPGAQEPVAPKKMERAVALDLLHAVYKHHGWKRAEGESMMARAHAIYNVTLDAVRNRYVAIPKNAAQASQGIDPGQLRALAEQWKQVEYPFSYEGQQAQRAADACRADLLALIDGQPEAAPGMGNG